MFAARARASLKPFFHGIHSFSVIRNREISTIPKRILHNRFNNGVRLSGIKLFHSSPRCYSSESEVGVKIDIPSLFSSLEDDFFSELCSVEKKGDPVDIINLLTKNPEPEISQETNGKKKKKKKLEETSDSISKLKLFTEKPELSWKTNGKRKKEEHACSLPVTDLNVFSLLKPEKSLSSIQDLDANAQNVIQATASLPSRDVMDSKSLSRVQDHESEAQNITSPSSEAKNEETSSSDSVIVIKISNLNPKTADSLIHSMCLSICPLEGLVRVNEDVVDVLFRVRNPNEADSILEELNDATVDCTQWTAEIVPEGAEEEEACEDQIGMRITRCNEDLDEQTTMRHILAKDLDVLLHSVMHLEKNHVKARETDLKA